MNLKIFKLNKNCVPKLRKHENCRQKHKENLQFFDDLNNFNIFELNTSCELHKNCLKIFYKLIFTALMKIYFVRGANPNVIEDNFISKIFDTPEKKDEFDKLDNFKKKIIKCIYFHMEYIENFINEINEVLLSKEKCLHKEDLRKYNDEKINAQYYSSVMFHYLKPFHSFIMQACNDIYCIVFKSESDFIKKFKKTLKKITVEANKNNFTNYVYTFLKLEIIIAQFYNIDEKYDDFFHDILEIKTLHLSLLYTIPLIRTIYIIKEDIDKDLNCKNINKQNVIKNLESCLSLLYFYSINSHLRSVAR
ncbi:hypothetical protein EDEG_02964 [Edhazardia aedis USNM 41457]|uniref:Uncharacterized protein n=1 Tax=Edhazardia aedis (strain USNM 41457) TaxID=1003232 RepID=J9D541_EDHAE|nr:hypothetical protein EDEG_02964 [Edhazardia aedis USNM 41457]|eukprot:EJW02644.1 hypothetical protein EDEG_02964 [Edhazardia aedis USNM 41457]